MPPELCILVGIPPKIAENKRIMTDIRQSLFQKPFDRIQSIKEVNKMIAQSQEVQEWDLNIQLEPDEIEAKILKRPTICFGQQGTGAKVLDDTNILRSIVH